MKNRTSGIIIVGLSLAIMGFSLLNGPQETNGGIVLDALSFGVAMVAGYVGLALIRAGDQLPMRMWRVDYFCPEESLAAFTCLINCRHRPTEAEVIKVMNVTFEPDRFETITITEAIAERTL